MSGDPHAPGTPGHVPLPPAYTRPATRGIELREGVQRPLAPFYGRVPATPAVKPPAEEPLAETAAGVAEEAPSTPADAEVAAPTPAAEVAAGVEEAPVMLTAAVLEAVPEAGEAAPSLVATGLAAGAAEATPTPEALAVAGAGELAAPYTGGTLVIEASAAPAPAVTVADERAEEGFGASIPEWLAPDLAHDDTRAQVEPQSVLPQGTPTTTAEVVPVEPAPEEIAAVEAAPAEMAAGEEVAAELVEDVGHIEPAPEEIAALEVQPARAAAGQEIATQPEEIALAEATAAEAAPSAQPEPALPALEPEPAHAEWHMAVPEGAWEPTSELVGPWEPRTDLFEAPAPVPEQPAMPAESEAAASAPEVESHFEATVAPEAHPRDLPAPTGEEAVEVAAARLEALAMDLRERGRAALDAGFAGDSLQAALAGVIAGYLARREH